MPVSKRCRNGEVVAARLLDAILERLWENNLQLRRTRLFGGQRQTLGSLNATVTLHGRNL